MNVCGVTFGGYLAKKLSFKLGNLLYKSNFYLLSEGTVLQWGPTAQTFMSGLAINKPSILSYSHGSSTM